MRKLLFTALLMCHSTLLFASPAEFYEKALTAFNQDKVGNAYVLLKNALQHDPEHLPSKLLMGRILLIDGHVRDAIIEFEEVLDLGADKNLVLVPLSRAYLLTGQYQKVLDLRDQSGLTDNVQLDLTIIGGDAYIRLGERERALAEYEQAYRRFPNNVHITNALASLYTKLDRFDEALELLTKSDRLQPNRAMTLHAFGQLYEAKEQYQAALSDFTRANALFPDNPAIMRSLAATYTELKEFDKANALIERIEQTSPDDVQIRLLKARILALTNQQLEADKILRELSDSLSLLSDEQRNERLQLSLITGVVAYINENYELSSVELARYSSERDASPEVLGMLADSLLNLGYFNDAIDALEKNMDKVVANLDVAVLTCELYIALNRGFKCQRLLPGVKENFPDAVETVLLDARLLASQSDYQGAIDLLNTKLADSRRPDVLEMRVILLGYVGQVDEARDLAERLVDQAPESLTYKNLFSDILIRTGELELAKQLNQAVIDEDARNISGLVTKARIQFAEGLRREALATLRQVNDIDKGNITALLLGGQINTLEGNYESAIDQLLLAKTMNTKDPRPRELLVSVYRQQGNYRNALSELNQLLSMNRLSDQYMLERAEVLIQLDRNDDATSQLQVLYAMWSEQPDRLVRLSQLQSSALDFEGAEKSLSTAITIAPNSERPQLELVNFLIQRERIEEAQDSLNAMVSRFGKTANVLLLHGHYAFAMRASESAFNYYNESHLADPSFSLPLIHMYELARSGISRDKFIAQMNAHLAENSEDLFAKHLLADMYYIDNNHDEAEQRYLQLLESEQLPRRYAVFNNLANIYAQKDLQKALTYINQAVSLNGESPAVLDTQGWLFTLSGQLEKGLDTLRRAFTLSSDDPTIHYHIAYTLNSLGRHQEALEELERNNTLARVFPEKQQAEELFNQLTQVQ